MLLSKDVGHSVYKLGIMHNTATNYCKTIHDKKVKILLSSPRNDDAQ